ncbi:PREDICTED: lysine-specific demethylase 5C isoform X2 [Tarenaya hassleriana]|uniref:lysine-specific demethylase 5C isoform X2 n=1 Tax=Tarenaya hassleriana TaxID=28532 RepID=UPI00053C4144|nr:PREDICTED: lysine-specific demethylase 5C isoform X2 [Tarenaya hassleriana]
MGKGRVRAVEKRVLDQKLSLSPSNGSLNLPSGPVYYPTEEEFKEPLDYIDKIRPEAELYGICKIVPPESWKPPFALNLESFRFPTKTQEIHRLQARPASCDPKTFELEYNRFLEEHLGKKLKKKVIFVGEELDLCKLFNAVKRFGGYDKVIKGKKWAKVFQFLGSGEKISECAKHVLCRLYKEHLYEYENYHNRLDKDAVKGCKKGVHGAERVRHGFEFPISKRNKKNGDVEKVKLCKSEVEEDLDQACEQCKSGLHGDLMLLCDRCNKGWHIYCLSPPLNQIPPGNWYCLECLNSDEDSFGFVPGKCLLLKDFKRIADRAKRKWFGSGSVSRMQIEKKFWEIVDGSANEVKVLYGNDLDTSLYGSGFPRNNDQKPETVEAEIWNEYCGSPWNLNNLPKSKGSMLQAIHSNINGVTVPWLYVGMLFSSFCWHFEDHCFYSVNYLHWGEAKCWYSVPGNEASAFEKVMRKTLPDLFDAQPDLLFQLVTLLSPTVLQENRVPVYTVLQEPGNFVITFPRSYHAGFNFGLNCAEAVNFAPADWLPHGGFGAELYKLYRKVAVISHEELLCVVAKQGDYNIKVSTHLKKELLRMYTKEKNWRERLQRSGILRSSPMSPRKCPEYVGTEEDPTCIICKQLLHLSAVICCCRPSASACLEHWKHLCECEPRKLRLVYRYTLAQLHGLVQAVGKSGLETQEGNKKNSQEQNPGANRSVAFNKKAEQGHRTQGQLAEEWLVRACKVLQDAFSSVEFATLLEEAEQFLWAGSEMDRVRDVAKSLMEAKEWAEAVTDCLSKIEYRLHHDSEKMLLEYVDELLGVNPTPCIHPCHLKLKDYAEEARKISQEIDFTLSTCPTIFQLELLHSKVSSSPIYQRKCEILSHKISFSKMCVERARKYLTNTQPAGIELDALYKLKSEILELQVQLPETTLLLDLLREAESVRAKCSKILCSSISLKSVEELLHEFNSFGVNLPELNILRQYHSDTVSWISRFNRIMVDIHESGDHRSVVDELSSLAKDGAYLSIQVEELSLVEVELKKASCREKAKKVFSAKSSLDFIERLMSDAALYAFPFSCCWEERAKNILASEAQMSDLEDCLRASEEIHVILPSVEDIKNRILLVDSWLQKSEPFLPPASSLKSASSSLLELAALKDIVSQSRSLKVQLQEPQILERLLVNCEKWQCDTCQLLQETAHLLHKAKLDDVIHNTILPEIKNLISRLESAEKSGMDLGFNFDELPKLQTACSKLGWCCKTISLSCGTPFFEEVESLLEAEEKLTCPSSSLWSFLVEGIKWLKRALEVLSFPEDLRRCKLGDAEEILKDSKGTDILYHATVGQLQSAICKHKLWQDDVHQFFNLKPEQRSWSRLLQLNELGKLEAFDCSERDLVLSEVGKLEIWKQSCLHSLGRFGDEAIPLLGCLQKVKQHVDISLCLYQKSDYREKSTLCFFCVHPLHDQSLLTCSVCKDCYHVECLRGNEVDRTETENICLYCNFFVSGTVPQHGGNPWKFEGQHPNVPALIELLSDAEHLCTRIEETQVLREIVDQAAACNSCLREMLDFAVNYLDRNVDEASKTLTIALKATNIISVHSRETNIELELALKRNLWKFRVNKLLEDLGKPTLQQIQQHLKEGQVLKIPPEEYFRQRLAELKATGQNWAERAKKVATDSGALALERVFELIAEGENLPVHMKKEIKSLRARSMLHCICRKPYDSRSMIACDQCGEWYHTYCVKLQSRPKTYECPACLPLTEQREMNMTSVEPKTPSRWQTISGKRRSGTSIGKKMVTDITEWKHRKRIKREAKPSPQVHLLPRFFSEI